METERIRLKTLLAALLSVALLETLGAKTIHVWNFPPLVALGCLRVLDIALLSFIVIHFEGSVLSIGLDSVEISTGIRRGVLWSLAFGLAAGLAALILYVYGIDPFKVIKTPLPKKISEVLFYFLVGGIISPVAEEFFFRGIVFLFFRRWGFLAALILSTTFFALLHPLSSGIPFPQIVGGLLFATAFEIEKNLMVPLSIHIMGNLSIFSLSWIAA